MKFKVVRSAFLDCVKGVQNIVTGKGSLPILQNVMIEAEGSKLTLTTTDLELSIRMTCEAQIIEGGATTLPVKFLFNTILNLAEGEIEVDVDENERATIKAGSAKFKLVGMPVSDFPKLPQSDDVYGYNLEQVVLREMLRKVSYAASQDDTRRTLKGVLMSFKNSTLTMVATDGRRLAMIEKEIEFPKDFERDIVLPFKVVQELQRSLTGDQNVLVYAKENQIAFKTENLQINSKLVDDVYPNYHQVIPAETSEHIAVDRQLLLDALERASVMSMDEAHSTKLIFDGGKLTVVAAANDIGEAKDEVPIKYVGEKIETMFNPSYLMDALKVIDDDEIIINLNNGHSPALIRCSIPFLYVIMPLRIN